MLFISKEFGKKVIIPKEIHKKLFNFEIKKDGGKKSHEFNSKFKFNCSKSLFNKIGLN